MTTDTIGRTASASGGVTYQTVDDSYFEQRQLKRHAGLFTLWMMGVGAVVAGEYSGWNIGLSQGGFGGMLAATVIIGGMYVLLCSSIGEMSAALPHTGGAYSFSRTALGPWGGFTTGLAENIEFVLAPGANMFFMSSYLAAIFGTPAEFLPVWWVVGYAVMLGLSMRGLELSMRVVTWITVAAILVLVFFYVVAIPHVDFVKYALNIGVGADGAAVKLDDGGGSWLPFGFTGVMLALPFGVYMFLAVEQLPLTAEEAKNPTRDMPRALILSIVTLIALALGVLFFSAAIPNGSFAMGQSGEPLLDGFRTIFGDSWAKLLASVAVLGLAASFFAGSFASGRNIYSLSRAGYLPTALSVTNARTQTPNIALAAGSGFALAVLLVVWFLGGKDNVAFMGGFLVSMIVFAGMVSYILQSIAYLRLKALYPNIARPFVSPFGRAGAVIVIAVCVLTLAYQFFDPLYRWAAVAAAAWYLTGLAYFAFYRRHRLVLSPEEEFAVSGGERGRPVGETA
ncbi:amino acid permease [Methylopila musalis]|uniref:Amino acid permease n=1 Tax=Methylopila musalis TaxID=1134781 RepID=A0ABW3ZA64_9HYPH